LIAINLITAIRPDILRIFEIRVKEERADALSTGLCGNFEETNVRRVNYHR